MMNRPTILIVDDEPKFLKSLSLILKREFNVLTALNGKKGLSVFESNPEISLIILDLGMPVMNGAEMLQKLREGGSDVKVLIITGNSTHEWASQCAKFAVCGYIDKPFDPDELTRKIKDLLHIIECRVLKDLWKDEYERRFSSLNQLVKGAINYLKQNIHLNIKRDDIASHLNISPDYLSKIFKDQTGLSLSDYTSRCRVRKSIDYMESNPFAKVKEIAAFAGVSTTYFCSIFKKYTGLSPLEFKKK